MYAVALTGNAFQHYCLALQTSSGFAALRLLAFNRRDSSLTHRGEYTRVYYLRHVGMGRTSCYSLLMAHAIPSGSVHALPSDFRAALARSPKARALWSDITPLARSEWICWVISGKKAETRSIRITKALSKMNGGMRRPCCWAGCPHR